MTILIDILIQYHWWKVKTSIHVTAPHWMNAFNLFISIPELIQNSIPIFISTAWPIVLYLCQDATQMSYQLSSVDAKQFLDGCVLPSIDFDQWLSDFSYKIKLILQPGSNSKKTSTKQHSVVLTVGTPPGRSSGTFTFPPKACQRHPCHTIWCVYMQHWHLELFITTILSP